MAFMQWAVPAGVLEGETFQNDIAGSVIDDQLLNAVALFGGAKQERRVALLAADNGLGPWVLKFQTAFRFHEGDNGQTVVNTDVLDTQDGDGPALVNHHL